MSAPRSRWAPVIGFALASSANQMAWLAFAPITTGSATYYGVSTSTIGLLSEIFPLLYVVLAVPASGAVDRSLSRWLGAGALVSAGGAVLRLAGTGRGGFGWVLAGQVVIAVAQPLLLNSLTALARRYLTPGDRPTGIAIGSAGTFLGFVLAFVSGGALGAGRVGAILGLGAAFAVVGAVLLLAALARSPVPYPSEALGAPTGWADLARLWADPVMRGMLCCVFVGFGVFVSLTTWVQPLLQPAGVSTATADVLLTAMVLAGVASSALLPPLVARHGLQLATLVAGGVATIAGCALLAIAPGVASAAAALIVVGLCLLPGLPVMLEVAERRSGESAAASAGFLWLAGQAGGIVVAVLAGAAEGTPWLAFSVLAAVVLLAVPAAARLRGRLSSSSVAALDA